MKRLRVGKSQVHWKFKYFHEVHEHKTCLSHCQLLQLRLEIISFMRSLNLVGFSYFEIWLKFREWKNIHFQQKKLSKTINFRQNRFFPKKGWKVPITIGNHLIGGLCRIFSSLSLMNIKFVHTSAFLISASDKCT